MQPEPTREDDRAQAAIDFADYTIMDTARLRIELAKLDPADLVQLIVDHIGSDLDCNLANSVAEQLQAAYIGRAVATENFLSH